jgi:hypothetical protein
MNVDVSFTRAEALALVRLAEEGTIVFDLGPLENAGGRGGVLARNAQAAIRKLRRASAAQPQAQTEDAA